MKPYAAFRWGEDLPCPLRFVVNPYKGCNFKCKYCYVWQGKKISLKDGFRRSLAHGINRANKMGLDLVVMVSSSTDPFNLIEFKEKETYVVLKNLLSNGFKVLVMTKNPGALLRPEYLRFTLNPNLYIDVSICSPNEDNPESIFFNPDICLEDKMNAVGKLLGLKKQVRIKIEPVIPTFGKIRGQTKDDLRALIKKLEEAGVRKVISKTLRLNENVPSFLYDNLIDYYKVKGEKQGITYCLNGPIRKKLLNPLFEECKKYGISFCACVDADIFSQEGVVNCRLGFE